MKRKICLLLAAVMLLLSFGSCANEQENAYERYTKAKTLYASGYEAKVNFKMSVGEESATGDLMIKASGNDASITRENVNDARYYVGGVAYRRGYVLGGVYYKDTDEEPARVRETCDKTVFEKECTGFFGVNPYATSFPTLTDEAIKNAEITVKNGHTAMAAELSIDAIKAYLGDSLITDASGVMVATFDEIDDMETLLLHFEIDYADGEQKLIEITYHFLNRGFVPAVMKPEDAETYIEL